MFLQRKSLKGGCDGRQIYFTGLLSFWKGTRNSKGMLRGKQAKLTTEVGSATQVDGKRATPSSPTTRSPKVLTGKAFPEPSPAGVLSARFFFFPSYPSLVSLHTLLFLYGFLIVLSHLSWITGILGQGTQLYTVKRQSF